MATVFKRAGRAKYYGKFQHEGKTYRFATGATTKVAATAELHRKMAEVTGARSAIVMLTEALEKVRLITDKDDIDESRSLLFNGLLDAIARSDETTRNVTRSEMANVLLQGAGATLLLADAWDAWINAPKKGTPGEKTLYGYTGRWNRYAEWMGRAHPQVKYLHEVTPAIAEEYAADIWQGGVSNSTYNSHIQFIRSLFKTLEIRAGLTHNVWDRIPNKEKRAESKRNLTPDELQIVCTKATGQMRHWLAIGIYTGMRLGDVVTLKWEEIDFEERYIRRVPMKTRRKGKAVSFPLHPVLETMLLQLKGKKKCTGYVFPETAARYDKDRAAISKEIQAFFSKTCGLETHEHDPSIHRKNAIVRVGFHSLRHSFVSLCAANNVPQVAIMELVGHGSPAMTALYSHAGKELKENAIAGLPEMAFSASTPDSGSAMSFEAGGADSGE
jgi:integrase